MNILSELIWQNTAACHQVHHSWCSFAHLTIIEKLHRLHQCSWASFIPRTPSKRTYHLHFLKKYLKSRERVIFRKILADGPFFFLHLYSFFRCIIRTTYNIFRDFFCPSFCINVGLSFYVYLYLSDMLSLPLNIYYYFIFKLLFSVLLIPSNSCNNCLSFD